MRPQEGVGRMLLLLLLLLGILDVAQARQACNTTAAPSPGKLHVHFITAEHISGARLGFAEAYRGSSSSSGRVPGAASMFDAVLAALLDSPDRTFVCSELAHFIKWWQQLHAHTRAAVRRLVQQGRWEFVNGGLVQQEQATSHFSAWLDQMTLGRAFLAAELGVAPAVAWSSSDAAGHSAAVAALLSAAGFEAAFQGGGDRAERRRRRAARLAERVWRPPLDACGPDCGILTIDFASRFWCSGSSSSSRARARSPGPDCAVELVMQGGGSGSPHTQQRLEALVDHVVSRAQLWSSYLPAGSGRSSSGRSTVANSSSVLFVAATNFSSHSAGRWFGGLDRLIAALNADGRVTASYSTPRAYLAARQQQLAAGGGAAAAAAAAGGARRAVLHAAWPLEEVGDDFPASLDGTDVWSGLFSTRPSFKGAVRRAAALLQATQQVEVLSESLPSSQHVTTSTGLSLLRPGSLSALARSVVVQQGSRLVPQGADTALLEFALALAHSSSGLSGLHRHEVNSDLVGRLQLGAERSAAKLLQGLQQLLHPAAQRPAAGPVAVAADAARSVQHRRRLAGFEGARQKLQQMLAMPAGSSSTAAAAAAEGVAPPLRLCLLLNESICTASVELSSLPATASGSFGGDAAGGFLLVVWNPLPWSFTWGVRVPVGHQAGAFRVRGPDGAAVAAQHVPLVPQANAAFWAASPFEAARRNTKEELALQVSAPPLGHAVYRVLNQQPGGSRRRCAGVSSQSQETRLLQEGKPVRLSTGRLEVMVSPATQGVSQVTVGGRTFHFSATLVQQYSRGAGACCVRATGQQVQPPRKAGVSIVTGPLLQEVREVYESLGTVVTRLWRGSDSLEIEWTVGPGALGAGKAARQDVEVLLRYETNATGGSGVLLTDANGLAGWLQRQPGPGAQAGLAAQLFPATSGFGIRGAHGSLLMATDRAQGVASLHPGQLDVLLQRATAADDGRGLGEALREEGVVLGQHVVSFSPEGGGEAPPPPLQQQGSTGLTSRHHQMILGSPLLLAFSQLPAGPYTASSSAVAAAAGAPATAGSAAQDRLSVTTLRWLSCDVLLLRLSHAFQRGEHAELSGPTQVQLQQLLSSYPIAAVREMSLLGGPPEAPAGQPEAPGWAITLQPMQTRTFHVTVQRQHSSCITEDGGLSFSAPGAAAAARAAAASLLSAAAGVSNSGELVAEKPAGAAAVLPASGSSANDGAGSKHGVAGSVMPSAVAARLAVVIGCVVSSVLVVMLLLARQAWGASGRRNPHAAKHL